MRAFFLSVLLALLPGVLGAQQDLTLRLPRGAEATGETVENGESYALPVGVYSDGTLPTQTVRGRLSVRTWRISSTSLSSLQVIDPLQSALEQAGYRIQLACVASECGGFDFRFATRVALAPAMFVDIFQYRFLSALHDNGSAVSVLASRVSEDVYVQVIEITSSQGRPAQISEHTSEHKNARLALPVPSGPLAEELMRNGHVVLEDLVFSTGSDSLEDRQYDSLAALAGFLKSDLKRRVVLVGHTDAVGDLQANIDLSRRRATSALTRLSSKYGVPKTQISAGGMGYLAPRASNLTQEGRAANRRVEAVILSVQ